MAWNSSYRKKNYMPGQEEPFKLSRSKIDMFIECPRCFYLDKRLGVSKPSMPSFTLNNAVDHLLKKEFDVHRANGTPHPMLKAYGLNLVPFSHAKINEWRENFVGVQYLHPETNLLIFGAVDDLWMDASGGKGGKSSAGAKNAKPLIHVVDYKATSKDAPVKELEDTKWHDQYRRQMEIYQWLLKHNDLNVSDTGYFVYVNGKRDEKAFDAKLEFDINVIPYTGKSDWIDAVLLRIKKCLDSEEIPKEGADCEHCAYRTKAGEAFKKQVLSKKK